MAPDFKAFLAANVLNDGSIVSYRSLSREMKVHNNTAKQMLYEFYQYQTSKKPGSVHATYLLSGTFSPVGVNSNSNRGQEDGEDARMQSSPFVSSQARPQEELENLPSVTLVTLVREEQLEEAMARYEQIPSSHIYSLGPSTVRNLQILSDCNRAIANKFATEDPLIYGKQYGAIQNSWVKRRSGRRPVVPNTPAIAAKPENLRVESPGTGKPTSGNARPSTEDVSTSRDNRFVTETKPEIKREDSRNSDKKIIVKLPTTKRENSDIFKSFSRPKPKLNREDTGSSTGASPGANAPPVLKQDDSSVQEDEPMKDASEGEQEDDFISQPTKTSDPKKSKAERAEQLRKMMEDDDDEIDTAAEASAPQTQDSMPLDVAPAPAEPSPEPQAIVTGGRRRGRRKVMKKKTIRDDEGYLGQQAPTSGPLDQRSNADSMVFVCAVTKEEPAWESFSEDEPLPPQKEKTPASTAGSLGKGKKGSVGAKVGQGNIMSFFGKK